MATLKEADPTSVSGSDQELATQEDTAGEQLYHRTPERRHVDALLDISEEGFLKELEPHEYHCYSGWEEAVRGWARVAPLSCILLTQKKYRKLKHKEVDNPTLLSIDPTLPNAESSASIAEPDTSPSTSFKKSVLLNQQAGCWSNTAVAARQADALEWTVLNATQKTTSHFLLEQNTLRETSMQPHVFSKYCMSENRPTKPQKHSHRSISTVVPIKNFTFLPPIKSPHLNPKLSGELCSGKKASEGEALGENGFVFDKKSDTKGTRVDAAANTEFTTYSAALNSKYQTYRQKLNMFSGVPVHKKYQGTMFSTPDTVQCTSYAMGKSLTPALHSSTAVGVGHMHPSYLFS